MKENNHLCNNCHYAATNTCKVNEQECEIVKCFDGNGFPSEEVISCKQFKKDTVIEDAINQVQSNLRSIKEINILIDQIMVDAGLESTLEKIGYLQALQHDYLQDARDDQ